jgi:hypothetical protein
MAGAVNTIGQSKRGGGDRSSRPAQLQARENEQKDQGRDFPADSGGWLRHCNRQRCLARVRLKETGNGPRTPAEAKCCFGFTALDS